MRGLGKDFNVVQVAADKDVYLTGAEGVTFFVYGATTATVITLAQGIDGASEKDVDCINDYYASNGIGGVWSHETSDNVGALSDDTAMTKKNGAAQNCVAIHVRACDLDGDNGFNTVECSVTGGTVVAVLDGLHPQRTPENLPVTAV